MRVVLDTNILVRAAADESGLAGRLLQHIAPGPHVLVISQYILGEVSRVLAYPRLQVRWHLTPEQIQEFAARLATFAHIVHPAGAAEKTVPGDPDDNPIVETAVLGRAEVLCTRDAHLHAESVVRYCARRRIRIMNDIELYRILR